MARQGKYLEIIYTCSQRRADRLTVEQLAALVAQYGKVYGSSRRVKVPRS